MRNVVADTFLNEIFVSIKYFAGKKNLNIFHPRAEKWKTRSII